MYQTGFEKKTKHKKKRGKLITLAGNLGVIPTYWLLPVLFEKTIWNGLSIKQQARVKHFGAHSASSVMSGFQKKAVPGSVTNLLPAPSSNVSTWQFAPSM